MKHVFILIFFSTLILKLNSQEISWSKIQEQLDTFNYQLDTTGLNGEYDFRTLNSRLSSKTNIFLSSKEILFSNPVKDNYYSLDEVEHQDVKTKLEFIAAQFSTFNLKFIREGSGKFKQHFELSFDSYVPCQRISNTFLNNQYATILFEPIICEYTYIPNERSLIPYIGLDQIQSSEASTFFTRNYHKRGWHWEHYSLRTPIAWEITKGSKDIVHIIGYDF